MVQYPQFLSQSTSESDSIQIKMCRLIILFVSFVNVVLCRRLSLELNDSCVVTRTNSNGVCRFVDDCPSVLNEIRTKRQFPTLCGFEGARDVICCPEQATIVNEPTESNQPTQSTFNDDRSIRVSTRSE